MADFDKIFESILHHEGRTFTDIKADRGGATKFGLTLATLQQLTTPSATAEDVQDLTEDEARGFYLQLWDEARADRLEISEKAGAFYFDNYVNDGPQMANANSTPLQRKAKSYIEKLKDIGDKFRERVRLTKQYTLRRQQ